MFDDPSPIAADPEWFRDLERTESRCREYLEDLRWPAGVECPRCSSSEIVRIPSRRRFWCRLCRYHFSVTAGTLFHNSHAPIWKWFLAAHLLIDTEGGLPANQLVRQLGGSYKTAWFIEHRVRDALMQSLGRRGGEDHGTPARDRIYDRRVVGPFHQHGLGHLAAYRAEREWMSVNAENPERFRVLVRALLHGEPLSYAELIGRGTGRNVPNIAAIAS